MFTVDKNNGNGRGTVNVSLPENSSSSQLNETMYVKSGTITRTVAIKQAAGLPDKYHFYSILGSTPMSFSSILFRFKNGDYIDYTGAELNAAGIIETNGETDWSDKFTNLLKVNNEYEKLLTAEVESVTIGLKPSKTVYGDIYINNVLSGSSVIISEGASKQITGYSTTLNKSLEFLFDEQILKLGLDFEDFKKGPNQKIGYWTTKPQNYQVFDDYIYPTMGQIGAACTTELSDNYSDGEFYIEITRCHPDADPLTLVLVEAYAEYDYWEVSLIRMPDARSGYGLRTHVSFNNEEESYFDYPLNFGSTISTTDPLCFKFKGNSFQFRYADEPWDNIDDGLYFNEEASTSKKPYFIGDCGFTSILQVAANQGAIVFSTPQEAKVTDIRITVDA